MLKPDQTLLFQGDSITDAGRNRELTDANKGLGGGYAHIASAALLASMPGQGLKCYNRGCSGHRVVDLYARWRVDTINLKPDVLSILIGVNDTWHGFMSNNGVEVPRYEQVYRLMLDYTKEQLPGIKLVLCEPFVLGCGVVQPDWVPEVKARGEIVRKLAAGYGAVFVPFQSMFDELLAQAPAGYWLHDGVHPTPAGHHAMAQQWLKSTGIK